MSDSAPHQALTAFWEGRWKSGETFWDHGRYAPPFEEFVEREGAPAGRILIPGPGSGHDVRYFAQLGAKVVGLDIAPTAIEEAMRRNPHPDADYQLGNILDPEPRWFGQFDWVIEHTCLCALPPENWDAYAAGIDAATIDRLFSPNFSLLRSWVPDKSYASREGREELRWYRLHGVRPSS